MSIKSKVTKVVSRQGLKLSKNSPHILFAVGAVGAVTATVLACRATLKLENTLERIQNDLDGARETIIDNGEYLGSESIERSDKDNRKDLVYAYSKGSFELVRLYAPAAAVGGLSLICLTSSHVQLTRRNTALTAAYSALHTAYVEYRGRVRDHVGEEAERDLYYGVTLEESKDAKGKTTAHKAIGDPNGLTPYACIFDEASPNWTKDPEINFLYVRAQQNYANDLLRANGHLFLNEVYDMLGINRSRAGSIVGWVVTPDSDNFGDNFVDFGIFDANSAMFVNGEERSIVLDFNVNGIVYDKI